MTLRAGIAAALAIALSALQADAIDISGRFRSPRNPERKVRKSTDYIVLHTTEAPAHSSLVKVSDRGECHYVVTEQGRIYRIVDRDREAFHAGRSMWCGREDVDKFSIGIECVGYHDRVMPAAQLASIRLLVKELQKMYKLSDDKVVCHSHVAYGAPNKWHKFKHRGRKRCGMLFAMPSVRARLGLALRPGADPDVRAGRLKNADEYLSRVLYGRIDTMRGKLGTASATRSRGIFSWLMPSQATQAPAKPAVKATSKSTPRKDAALKSESDLKKAGYRLVGTISAKNTAGRLAGKNWNTVKTYYVIRNKLTPGTKIDDNHIEKGMRVWVKK